MGPAGVRSTGREVGGGARGWGVCGRAEGQTCRVTEAAPHRAPFCDGGLSPMAGRGFRITGTDTSTSSCVPIPVGHEGSGRHRPRGHLPQQCLERQCSVVGATTGTLGGLGAIQEGRALWPWLGPAGLWPGAARLGSYSLGSADGHRLPVPHPHTGPSPTRPALEGQEDRMGPAPKLPKPRQV